MRSQVGWILEFEATNKQASAAVLWYFKWLKRMAEQGNAEAQYLVGSILRFGRNGENVVLLIDAEEVKWLRKAAEQGHAEAQGDIGWLLSSGDKVTDDVVEGYAWLLLAEENGNEDASEWISDLEKILTVEQGKKGQARAAELRRLIEQKSAK